MTNKRYKIIVGTLLVLFCVSCTEQTTSTQLAQPNFVVDFEKFTLDNGLEVVFHIDRSDPITAVAMTFHVGSAREKAGRTGFAHLFEHLLFLESENLGKGGLDKLSAKVGGSGANGSTSTDRTNYFQTVPNDALEKMLWADADKLGFFINTVTDPVLAKEKQVVKNEKRQGVDNRPYGHTSYVIDKNMYSEDHPYNWQVIGSLEDLQQATLEDVKAFYNTWYVPNNATLVVAGDFDVAQAKGWVEKYFGEIPRGEDITPLEIRAAQLTETKKLYHEDNFARLPALTMAWPTVPRYHADSYALDMLAQLLSDGKKAPFNHVLIEDKKLTSSVGMFGSHSELAGEFWLRVTAFENENLNDVQAAIDEAFAVFEQEGFSEKDLNRIKAGQETQYYRGLASVLGKAFQLAQYNIFADDPGFINQDVQHILAVTKEDVLRVYEQYIKEKNYVATSFVPRGQPELILDGSYIADVVEERVIQGAEEEFILGDDGAYERTPSRFDRTIEPPYGAASQASVPAVWEQQLTNGMRVSGIENNELPVVQFNLILKGGLLLDDPDKVGVANLVAQLMTKGTKNKTTEALEEAIDELGATINVRAGREAITISGNSLARNYNQTMALVNEIILEPRWDEEEFDLAKQATLNRIIGQQADPNRIAANAYNILLYGREHILSNNSMGSQASVGSITLDDLKAYYASYFSPPVARFHVVGAISEADVAQSLDALNARWAARDVVFSEYTLAEVPQQAQVYFYDVPNAKQSVLRFGYRALAATDEDYYPASVTNYILGGGGFASRLTQQLREGKGYTYGIGSSFSGTDIPGPFTIGSGVRSNVTYESAALVKDIIANYGSTFTEHDLEVTKSFLLKSNARAFETTNSKLNMLANISAYHWPHDYVKRREEIVRTMTVEQIRALAAQYLDPDKMIYLVVGDAATQLERLKQLGFGDPVLLNDRFMYGSDF